MPYTGMNPDFYVDLIERQQHVLIAGMTGSGKSVIINGMINSILFSTSLEHKMILIDPKRVELSQYKNLTYCDRFETEIDKIEQLLDDCLGLIDRRFKLMEERGEKLFSGVKFHIFVDELADLMLNSKKAANQIQRIGQIGRAANVQLVCATQTPISEVIPTRIKVNFGVVIGLHTRSKQDSRNIVGVNGCESLPLFGKALIIYPGADIKETSVPMVPEKQLREVVEYRVQEVVQLEKERKEKEESEARKAAEEARRAAEEAIQKRNALLSGVKQEIVYYSEKQKLYDELDRLRFENLPELKSTLNKLTNTRSSIKSMLTKKRVEVLESNINECVNRINTIRNELYDYYIANENKYCRVEFTNPRLIRLIYPLLESKRANDVTAAVSILLAQNGVRIQNIQECKKSECKELSKFGIDVKEVYFCPSKLARINTYYKEVFDAW